MDTCCSASYHTNHMSLSELRLLLPQVIDISHSAGRRILEIYDAGFEVETKSDGSPLTSADKGSHNYIVSALSKLTPDIPMVSEESSAIDYSERRQWREYWLIDPLDGTKEFVKRSGEFTVNIALMQNNVPTLGVVHTPVKGWTHWGYKDGGAWLKHDATDPVRIQARQYEGGKATVVASRSHGRGRLQAFLDTLSNKEGPYDLANMGSALKICLVAEGSGDIYPRFGPTGEWDTAAADIVLSEAGGRLVGCDMKQLKYNKEILLNPSFLAICGGAYDWSLLLANLDTG
jgi:3'(2'), 5'-bisphosphate nucleotidase